MDFEGQGISFEEADRLYSELKRRYDAGEISDEEFEEQRTSLMVRDEEGRWWAKSHTTGEWHYYNGTTWIRDTPPGTTPAQARPHVSPPSDDDLRPGATVSTRSVRTRVSSCLWVVVWILLVLVALIVMAAVATTLV